MNSVLLRNARKIDLSNEIPNAVDIDVLLALKNSLLGNDFYIYLDLSNNQLDEECISMICALLKGRCFLQGLEMRNCGITDKMFSMHLLDGILARNTITMLDLSKNKALTDASAAPLTSLIRGASLKKLLLTGTSLTETGGGIVVEALQGDNQMMECVLPFTVGYKNLERLEGILERNRLLKEREKASLARKEDFQQMLLPYQKKQKTNLLSAKDDALKGRRVDDTALTVSVGKSEVEQLRFAEYYTERGRKNAMDSGPARARNSIFTTNELPGIATAKKPLENTWSLDQRARRDPVAVASLASLRKLDSHPNNKRATHSATM